MAGAVSATVAIDRIDIEAQGLTFGGRACGPRGGRPVLLLHGFPQTLWAWREVLFSLGRAGFRAVAPDQRGYSRGARPDDLAAYATELLVSDVLALADSLGMSRFDLVGHDWGGLLGWIVASRHPGRVRSLTVVSTPHPLALRDALQGPDPAQEAAARATAALQVSEIPEQLLLGPNGEGSGLATLLTETGLDTTDTAAYVRALREPGALRAALAWFRSMDAGVLDDVGPVAVPTLYVWSTADEAFGRPAAEATARHVEGPYAFEVLEHVSHWIPEMAPVELSDLVIRHLVAH